MRHGHKLCLQSAYVVIFAAKGVFLNFCFNPHIWVLTSSPCSLEVRLNPAEDSLADLYVLKNLDFSHTFLGQPEPD